MLGQQWPVAESLLLAQGQVDDVIAAYQECHRCVHGVPTRCIDMLCSTLVRGMHCQSCCDVVRSPFPPTMLRHGMCYMFVSWRARRWKLAQTPNADKRVVHPTPLLVAVMPGGRMPSVWPTRAAIPRPTCCASSTTSGCCRQPKRTGRARSRSRREITRGPLGCTSKEACLLKQHRYVQQVNAGTTVHVLPLSCRGCMLQEWMLAASTVCPLRI